MSGKNRHQMLLILAGVGLALLLGDRLILGPLIRAWKERVERIGELTKWVNQGSLLLAREEAIVKRWAQMRANTLPEDVSAAENELLKAFERWSDESRISISSIKPEWKRAAEDYVTLECRADAFGTIEAVTQFLHEVEKDPLALRVEAVEITARDNDGRQISLALQVSGLQLSTLLQ